MRTSVSAFGLMALAIALMALTIAADRAALAGQDKKKEDKAAKEVTVVDYDSKTHGAVQVKSASKDPGDWFTVFKDGKLVSKDNPPLLDGTQELPPGTYVVDVHKTQRKVTIEAGKKTILLTGDLMVESKNEGYYWIPKQGKETKLVSNPPVVNSRVALFPGKYTVLVQTKNQGEMKNLGTVEVKPGEKTVVKDQ